MKRRTRYLILIASPVSLESIRQFLQSLERMPQAQKKQSQEPKDSHHNGCS